MSIREKRLKVLSNELRMFKNRLVKQRKDDIQFLKNWYPALNKIYKDFYVYDEFLDNIQNYPIKEIISDFKTLDNEDLNKIFKI